MSYSDFLELIKRNTSNELGNYQELCRICLENHANGVDISENSCSSIKQREAIQNNYNTITKQYLPTSDEYPKLVCLTCETRLNQLALFAQQIEKNAENWEIFLASGRTSTDVADTLKDCGDDCKPVVESETIEIKIEFCEGKCDIELDTDANIYDALDVPPVKIEEINTESFNDVPKAAKRKRKKTRTLSYANSSTEFERTCKHCDAPTFSSLARMYSHQKQMHPGIKIYSCDHCGATFISKNAVISHMNERHASCGRKHQCQFCAKLFYSDREVRGHEKLHLNARSYVCNLCGKGFNQKTRLNVHLRSKAHNANYKTIKHKKYPRKKQVYKKTYRCEQCVPATVHPNADELANHRNLVHKVYECNVCKNSFLTENTLNSHKLLHSTKPRPHVCSECNATFNQSSHLSSHFKRKHTAEKSFECALCDNKAFFENFELNSHMNLVHRKQERAKCNECGSDFASNKYLQKHIRLRHSTKASPFDCNDCGKKNESLGKLELHRLKCHKADNEKCEISAESTLPDGRE
ncbi:zinc finger protein 2 homolog isoform X1 [Bradysia coprophila]|uniref:zinc finger protein 2 homolog isoform X1 n=1 Tax=Bradysia coprophila TaxID=38358 RepID=UPI00187D9F0E|nr:zinc finger protein 2 homolog isoform X1 [Bradysia coprophila]